MPDCKTCKENRQTVPYLVHEAAMARLERTIKRLWIALLICIAGIIGMFIYESQYIDEQVTIEAETDGGNAIANGDGEVHYYGESESD